VLTDTLARINDAAGKHEGLGNAIDNDDACSSNWLRIKDFQQDDLRGRIWFGRLRDNGLAGVGSRDRAWQLAPATTQAR